MTATNIFLVTDNKLHRGYRDESGRFTLEQCNLAKAAEVDNLREFNADDKQPDDWAGWEMCEHCFPGEDYVGRIP